MRLEPCVELLHGATDAALGVRLGDGLLVRLAAGACEREHGAPRAREQPVIYPPVHGRVRVAREQFPVRAQDVPHGLAFLKAVPDCGAHFRGGLVVGVDARAAVHERAMVRGLRPVCEIEFLHERARPLMLAPVADERSAGEALADGLAEVGARLEASRLVLREGLVVRRPVRRPCAYVEPRAEAVRASVALVAGHAVVDELSPYRRRGLAERARNPRDALVGFDPELDLSAHY